MTGSPCRSEGSSRPYYRPELDAMRFFAFLCIFFHHVLSRPEASAGAAPVDLRSTVAASLRFAVSLFFLLSGYLITNLLVMEKESTGRVHAGAFYLRRIARIWPLYYSFVLLTLLLGTAVTRLMPSSSALASFVLFSGNWFVAGGGVATGALGILWSINVEEQFYLLWPIFPKLGGRCGLLFSSAAIVAASYAYLVWCGIHGITSDIALRFNTMVEMQFFAIGALLAISLPRSGINIPVAVRPFLGLLGIGSWWAATRFFSDGSSACIVSSWATPAALYAGISFGCIALFLAFFGTPAKWLPQPLLWLGRISYGLYVYHAMVLTLTPRWPANWPHHGILPALRLVLMLVVTILVAGLSYRWLEQPFLRWKESFTFIPNRRA